MPSGASHYRRTQRGLRQLLVNLIVNARDAIVEAHGEDGGVVTLLTGIDEDSVLITIADNGAGVADDASAEHL